MSENWQFQAKSFSEKHNLQHTASVYALDIMSELGEVAKEILLATDYGTRSAEYDCGIAGELGDVVYSLCLLATAVDVDLEKAFTNTLRKYEKRTQNKGHIGSQNT